MITREIKVGDRLRHCGQYGEIVVGHVDKTDGWLRDTKGATWAGPFCDYKDWSHVDEPQADIEQQVCGDILARQRLGVAKYGTTVAGNQLSLQQWLNHAYEECLDQAVYLRRAIDEIDRSRRNGE